MIDHDPDAITYNAVITPRDKIMNRHLHIALFALATLLLSANLNATESKTNFVFILVDDLGYKDISPNNPDTFYETPNLERLADSSTRFTDGYAANPVCSPTRYSIMTGKWLSRI